MTKSLFVIMTGAKMMMLKRFQ